MCSSICYPLKKLLRLYKTSVEYTTFFSGDTPREVLIIIHRFGNHCSCYLQGEYEGYFTIQYKRGLVCVKRGYVLSKGSASNIFVDQLVRCEDLACKVLADIDEI